MKTYIKPFTRATEMEPLHLIAATPASPSSLSFGNHLGDSGTSGSASGWYSKGTDGWEDEDKAE